MITIMPSAKVYGNKPDEGPGELSAKAALEDMNKEYKWDATLSYTADRSLYTSEIATEDELVTYLEESLSRI